MKLDSFLAGLACGFIITSSYVIIDTARYYKPPIPREATWERPDIQECDKELWLRVKDGCDE